MPNVRTYRNFFSEVWKTDPDFTAGVGSLTNTVYVRSLADLPEPDEGVITLEENKTYHFVGPVNIGANVIKVQDNSHLTGSNWGYDSIVYTGTDYAVIAEGEKMNMKFMGIVAPAGGAIHFNSPDDKLTVFLCGFLAKEGCWVENSDVAAFEFSLFRTNSDHHLRFTGDVGKIFIDACVFEDGQIGVLFEGATLSIADLASNFFFMPQGTIGIKDDGATITNQAILKGNTFDGDFTFTDGFDETSIRYVFSANTGITDSSVSGGFLGTTPTTVTITTQNAWVKLTDTFSAATLERMTYEDGALTYVGLRPYRGRVIVSIAGEAPQNNQTYEIAIFKNGELTDKITPIEYRFGEVSQSTTLNDFLVLETDDEFDVRVRNTISTQNFNLQTIAVTFN